MNDSIAFFTVDYEDGDANSYKGLELTYGDKVKLFNSGDPLIDWYDYCKFIYGGGAEKENIVAIGCSSSIDGWFMDTDEYIEKYIKYDEESGKYIFFTNDELDNMSFSELKSNQHCVISKDMTTFDELKEYYKNKTLILI
jgi:hypothetical protein